MDEAPATLDIADLLCFLEQEVLPWYVQRRKEVASAQDPEGLVSHSLVSIERSHLLVGLLRCRP